ncbi:Transcriptional regulator, AcrR family [Olavius algarvensis associated proteobacterium Delta 3]|nr:Transcriptional regulator, AcrR family [Olavius algarvensis associated proteobacterium Delta 3]CAB5098175.1 Transcriptional regulator, AcrR family [Olavius algarvensis associated proteobacterium Delta 3]
MNTREARKEKTVQCILDTAAQVFAETGYEGARMDNIADRAGVNKAMIYYHIGNKEALYTRVLHDVLGDTAVRMAENINRADTPTDKIHAYVQSIGRTVEIHPHLPRIMMREFASGGLHLPEVVVKDLASIIGLVRDVIQEGCSRGEFTDVDPLILHLMVMGGIGYFKTSGPFRRKYSALMEGLSDRTGEAGVVDLIGEIERIVLSALTNC